MTTLKKPKFPVKSKDLIQLKPQNLRISKNCNDVDKNFILKLKFYYHHRHIKEIIIDDSFYNVVHTQEISIAGLINDHISALYKNEISKSTVEMFKEKKPNVILYIYNGFKPVVSNTEANPAGLVELLFIRYLLVKNE